MGGHTYKDAEFHCNQTRTEWRQKWIFLHCLMVKHYKNQIAEDKFTLSAKTRSNPAQGLDCQSGSPGDFEIFGVSKLHASTNGVWKLCQPILCAVWRTVLGFVDMSEFPREWKFPFLTSPECCFCSCPGRTDRQKWHNPSCLPVARTTKAVIHYVRRNPSSCHSREEDSGKNCTRFAPGAEYQRRVLDHEVMPYFRPWYVS